MQLDTALAATEGPRGFRVAALPGCHAAFVHPRGNAWDRRRHERNLASNQAEFDPMPHLGCTPVIFPQFRLQRYGRRPSWQRTEAIAADLLAAAATDLRLKLPRPPERLDII